jgi:NTP pyrophosphatase (non-canonical NTP hydrolase)
MIQNATEEVMANLIEECSEVIKCITKIERFSHESSEEKKKARLDHLKEEIVDVIGTVSMLFAELELTEEEQRRLFELGKVKLKKRYQYMRFKPKTSLEDLTSNTYE